MPFPTEGKLTLMSLHYYPRETAHIFNLTSLQTFSLCNSCNSVLIFLPSYSLLRRCSTVWQTTDPHGSSGTVPVWERLIMSKKHVIVEPTGGQEEFELAKDEYKASVATNGGCVLLAVYRGKMSEGISFNDNNARCVICVGVPLPNYQDRAIVSKRAYNDEQRALHRRTDLLSGNEWYKQQAYRALAQALGRCIRHCADYGVVVLMDERHCDDGSSMRDGDGLPDAHRHLPKWMRHHVQNLDSSDQPLVRFIWKARLVCEPKIGLLKLVYRTLSALW